ELAGDHVEVIIDHVGVSVDSPREAPLVDAMTAAGQAEDPGSRVLPYCLSAGTDNKPLSALGITGYGFAPPDRPADLGCAPLFRGGDERGPVEAVRFGARVVLRLMSDC